jgi:hypothetical protein
VLAISGLDVTGEAIQQIGTAAERRITDDAASVDLGERDFGSQKAAHGTPTGTVNLSHRLDLYVVDEVSTQSAIWLTLLKMMKEPASP